MTQKNSKIQAQIELLHKGSDEDLIQGFQTLRKDGSPTLVPVILERWKNSSNEALNNRIFEFMVDIRPQEALGDIMNAIHDPNFVERKNSLISILWQSSLDASEYLVDLIAIALAGDYLTVLEVSTVIESFDTAFNEQDVMEIIYQIDERMEEESNEELVHMMNSLKNVVAQLPVD